MNARADTDPVMTDLERAEIAQATRDALEALVAAVDPNQRQQEIETLRDGIEQLSAPPHQPSDQEIVSAARHSGLCFADCWYLEEAIDPDAIAINRDWIAAADNECDRQERQHIVDHAANLARSRLDQLRLFLRCTSPS